VLVNSTSKEISHQFRPQFYSHRIGTSVVPAMTAAIAIAIVVSIASRFPIGRTFRAISIARPP
jgi:hypothetical protein